MIDRILNHPAFDFMVDHAAIPLWLGMCGYALGYYAGWLAGMW